MKRKPSFGVFFRRQADFDEVFLLHGADQYMPTPRRAGWCLRCASALEGDPEWQPT